MKLVLYMAMTVNGYIAKENDETPWSAAIWKSYYSLARKFKAIIIGRRTYQIMAAANEFSKIGSPFIVVLTSKPGHSTRNLVFVKTNKDAVKLLENKGFTDALIGGGGKLNASFISEGLISEICLDIEPAIFGTGIKLFSDGHFEAKLRLLKVSKLSGGSIQLCYKVIN